MVKLYISHLSTNRSGEEVAQNVTVIVKDAHGTKQAEITFDFSEDTEGAGSVHVRNTDDAYCDPIMMQAVAITAMYAEMTRQDVNSLEAIFDEIESLEFTI
jgi:hypothetical protein